MKAGRSEGHVEVKAMMHEMFFPFQHWVMKMLTIYHWKKHDH